MGFHITEVVTRVFIPDLILLLDFPDHELGVTSYFYLWYYKCQDKFKVNYNCLVFNLIIRYKKIEVDGRLNLFPIMGE